jgi:Flp pilus assembly protein TadG
MMMRRLRAFAADHRGLAAMEFALIAPIVVTVLLLGVDGWLENTQISQVRTAMQTGARYYETGGNDDTVAQTVAMASWVSKPNDAAMSVVRSCTCGSVPIACTSLCAGSNPPSAFITVAGSATYAGLIHTHAVSQSDIVRVR